MFALACTVFKAGISRKQQREPFKMNHFIEEAQVPVTRLLLATRNARLVLQPYVSHIQVERQTHVHHSGSVFILCSTLLC